MKLNDLKSKRLVIKSQFDVSKLQKQLQSVLHIHLNQSASIGPLPFKCVRDSKPQQCVQQLKLLKVLWNATNRDKHINEASKQTFASNLFKISCKYMESMLCNWKICFNVINIQTWQPSQPIQKLHMLLEQLCVTDLTLSKRRLNERHYKTLHLSGICLLVEREKIAHSNVLSQRKEEVWTL